MEGHSTVHAGRTETTQCSSYVKQSGESGKYIFRTTERCVVYFHTAFQYLNGHNILFWISLWKPARRNDIKVVFFCICILMTLCTVHLHQFQLHQLIMLYKVSLMKMPIEPNSSNIIYWNCLSNQRFFSPS